MRESLYSTSTLQRQNGDSAVINAVVGYEPATLRELVRAGSDLNLQNQAGLTPLIIAARSGRTDITSILLEGEHINLDIQENAAKLEKYPLTRIEELFASLAGGKLFTPLDLSHAYVQIPLDKHSRRFVTINTHKGLFEYKRLPFGVASAPSIFQRVMENS
ncbi:Uncharacterized protein K02A2.6 [Geodia barretti]|uniref:Uncharacterized protein K02A2.6 n=1 Tax=Geodia barretti TaxID=519541 RepID=A0AA35WKU5_GEOBA|nr:Uncharacterized protein K02A2.6 [Geodia barretti]